MSRFKKEDFDMDPHDYEAVRRIVDKFDGFAIILGKEQAGKVEAESKKAGIDPADWILEALNAHAEGGTDESE